MLRIVVLGVLLGTLVPAAPVSTTATIERIVAEDARARPEPVLVHGFWLAGSSSDVVGVGRLTTFSVEVEDGITIDVDRFASTVERILFDPRGWTARGTISLRRVDRNADIRITLASPVTTDRLCRPLRTGGWLSCFQRGRAVINHDRWLHGAASHDRVDSYRRYLINHEVGHGLGFGHRSCPAAGARAPIMMQQTKSVGQCEPNGWPNP